MKFNLDAVIEHEEPRSFPISVPLTETMREEVKMIKRTSERNKKLVNELSRQFFAQLIEKFHKGEFEDQASA